MNQVSISNIDEVLRALRAERNDIEKREKARDEEYKRATKLYIKALQKETEAFEKNRPNYDKRNESFKDEVHGIMERFKVGAFGLLKTRDRLHKEIERLNNHLLEHYPKLASEVKEALQKEKEEIELRLQRAKEENERNNIPHHQIRIPAISANDIREKRQELERDLKPSNYQYLNDLSNKKGPADSYMGVPSYRQSPLRNQINLENFVQSRPIEVSNYQVPVFVDPRARAYEEPYVPNRARSLTPPNIHGEARARSKSPKTDILSDFMIKFPKNNTMLSPEKPDMRKNTPAKSESLLYSPFSGTGENESRASMRRSQNL